MQLFLSKETLGDELFDLFFNNIDVGDFIEATGVPFVTKRETQAIGVTTWRVLTKLLQQIPTEHFGFKDEDMRYRKRYLDLLLDQDLREIFLLK